MKYKLDIPDGWTDVHTKIYTCIILSERYKVKSRKRKMFRNPRKVNIYLVHQVWTAVLMYLFENMKTLLPDNGQTKTKTFHFLYTLCTIHR